MAYPPLEILGYSEAAMYLRGSAYPRIGAIISIHGRREFGVELNGAKRIDLAFDDVDVPAPGDLLGLQIAMSRKRWAQENGLIEVAPTPAHAAAIIAFAREIQDVTGTVLCHCGGGMSRAPAAALICLAVWSVAGAEADCVAEVLRLRRGAVPHAGLVRFADEQLGRGGRLVTALAEAKHLRELSS